MLNIAIILESAAREHPDRDAIVFEGERIGYAELDRRAGRVAANLMAAGIGRGDHVALACPNRPEFVIACYGILKTGATVVTVSALLKAREIAYQLADSEAVALIAYGGPVGGLGAEVCKAATRVPGCRHVWIIDGVAGARGFDELLAGEGRVRSADTDFDDTAVILYTSGTTGQPKGAELTHGNIMMNVVAIGRERSLNLERPVSLVALPLFHVFAQTCLMHAGLYLGATLVLMQRFEPRQAVDLIRTEGVASFAGVPTMFRAILDDPSIGDADAAALGALLKVASSGGASLAPELQKRFADRFGVPMVDGYGCTETSPVACFFHDGMAYRAGSCGQAAFGVQLKVIDGEGREQPPGEVGELCVKGHGVMKGYWKRPEDTARVLRDGWYHTGDLARIDEDGYVYIVGRLKELIIRGGFNVYPAEVEAALMTHPAVGMAAVFGVPHETHGEEIMAVVSPRPGMSLAPDELRDWAREQMAAYKYPRIVEVRAELPLGPTGKVLKRDLVPAP
jgi:long-chain acyl-CoA synthetase